MKIARRRRKILGFWGTKNTILLRKLNISEVQNPKIFACGELFLVNFPPIWGGSEKTSPPGVAQMGGKLPPH